MMYYVLGYDTLTAERRRRRRRLSQHALFPLRSEPKSPITDGRHDVRLGYTALMIVEGITRRLTAAV